MLKNIRLKNIKDKSGFTMVEVVTVILVISIGMTGILSLIVQNIRSQSINKNTLVAYQLAQEGIELVREVRDTNWRGGITWNQGIGNGTYYMDYTDAAPISATFVPGSGKLKQDINNFYIKDPEQNFVEGSFYRIISINYPDNTNPEMMLVKSNVYWIESGGQHSYTLEAELYNWKPTS